MKSKSQALTNQLKVYRTDKGLSQTQLAELVGVKRQAIYDIESGKYAPNTLIALRLAKHLSCRVEDLFNEEIKDVTSFTLVGSSLAHAARVSLARVRGSLIAYPLPGSDPFSTNFEAADGLISPGQDSIKLLCPPDVPDKTLILLGCDPAFALLSAYVSRKAPDMRINYRFASSLKAVNGLASGHAHLAGTHLHSGTSAHGDNIVLAQKAWDKNLQPLSVFRKLKKG